MTTSDENLMGHQFDLHARYVTLAKILEAALASGAGRRILDVGAGPNRLTEAFLPPGFADVTRTDVESFGDPGVVAVPPGSPLPFEDGCFDAVVAMDVLEHVLPAQRSAFVRECLRVAGQLAVIAAPIGDLRVREAEQVYGRAYRRLFDADERFLEEHGAFGLPEPADVTQAIEEAGAQAVCIDNVRLADWLALNVVNLYLSTVNDGDEIRTWIARLHNETVPAAVQGAQHYRRFYVCTRDRGLAARLSKIFDPAELPPDTRPGEPLQIVAEQFKDYAFRYHAPTLDAVLADRARTIQTLQDVVDSKEQHIAGLNGDMAAKEQYIAGLSDAVRGKDQEIVYLHDTVRAKDEHIAKLDAAFNAKDEYIAGLGDAVQAKDQEISYLNAVVQAKDEHIAKMDEVFRVKEERLATVEHRADHLQAQLLNSLQQLQAMVEYQSQTSAALTEVFDMSRAALESSQETLRVACALLEHARNKSIAARFRRLYQGLHRRLVRTKESTS